MTDYRFDPNLARRRDAPVVVLRRPRGARAGEARRLRPHLAARRARGAGRRAGRLLHGDASEASRCSSCGKDEVLRAISNVCRHRAGPVACGEGKARRASSAATTAGATGSTASSSATPEFDGRRGVRPRRCAAPAVPRRHARVARLREPRPRGATARARSSARSRRCSTPRRAARYRLARAQGLGARLQLEGLRRQLPRGLPHPDRPSVAPPRARLRAVPHRDEAQWYSQQHAPMKRPSGSAVTAGEPEVRYYWIYPNLMINVYADNFSTNLILPLGPRRTLTVFEWFFPDPEDAARRRRRDRRLQRRDPARGHRHLRGRAARPRVAATTTAAATPSQRENGVHHFHGLYVGGDGDTETVGERRGARGDEQARP